MNIPARIVANSDAKATEIVIKRKYGYIHHMNIQSNSSSNNQRGTREATILMRIMALIGTMMALDMLMVM